ncbi:MAG TPA: hypothetical protein VG456_11925 [Candidatus Sulfopaludibacter sp.]|jgi:hypothetical protein|nr:hypothetical protein [Candidatus Sulfopaludibacter sp.]
MRWLLLLAAVYQAHSALVCDPQKFAGSYGVQLSGTTTISGEIKPVAAISRLVFDGKGSVSGYSSVNFTGLLLGNPVNGSYQAGTDCSLQWSLQDTSGAYQHFAGTAASDYVRIRFRQTDKGAAHDGAMIRMPKECSVAILSRLYDYTFSSGASGLLEVTGGGNLVVNSADGLSAGRGTVQIDSDCMAQFQLTMPNTNAVINLRGVLLDEGREIRAIQTDPGPAVTAKFTFR